MLSYQGKLTDTLGVPVNDTTYQVTFRLYTVPTGGASFWNETQTVRTRGGLFSALLGSVTPIDSVPSAGAVYLGMTVSGGPELAPRIRIGSSAFAYLSGRAASADLLQGKDTAALDSRYVNEGQASSVTSNMIVDGTIAAADLGQMGASTGQVMKWTGSAWQPRNDSLGGGGGGGTVTSVGQATGVVCSPNPITTTGTVRFDSTWGDARFVNEGQANSVTGAMIVDGAVSSADIRDTTVNTADLKDGSVTSAKIFLPYIGSVATSSDAFSVTNTLASNDAAAVYGSHAVTDNYGIGVRAIGGYEGVNASVTPTGSSQYYGVYSTVMGGSGENYGVEGYASGSGTNYGVGGSAGGSGTNYGVYGSAAGGSTNYAGYFDGDVKVNGQCHGVSTTSNVQAMLGEGGTYGSGVYGTSATSSWWGSYGRNTHANGTGILGAGNNTTGTTLAAGSGVAGTGTTCGVYGHATQTTGGVFGSYGDVNSSYGFGSYGGNTNASGTGVMGVGNNGSSSFLTAGSGLAGTGTQFGVYGRATDTASCCGGYFSNGHGGSVHVAYYYNGTEYKISGTGTVSTIMATREGKKNLFAPEMPEAYFEDCGEGQLSNGHCRVNLEKLFSDCITVNAEHPLRVFVQLEDDCKGVYVNKDATGFDVRELQGGASNARFSWRVLAKWKGNENVRLPEAPGPQPTVTTERPVPVEGKTTTATPPRSVPGRK
jgi:hypothetical protein